MTAIDLIVNVWERTYRSVLQPGFLSAIEEQNQRTLIRKLVINNVADREAVMRLADDLVARGELDSYYIVADQLPLALAATGLSHKDLGRVPHYSDGLLVAVTLPGNEWFLHWDAEIRLRRSANWLDPAIELMSQNTRILAANPNWGQQGIESEAVAKLDGFALSYGFSDQCFLARRSEFAQPIYKCWCPVSLRYPLSHITPIFEQRVDAFARSHRRLRATYLGATYEHPNEGASYPGLSLEERIRKSVNWSLLHLANLFPTSDPRFKINPGRLNL